MTKKTHIASSLLLTSAMVYYTPVAVLPSICSLVGSTLPDIDLLFGVKHHRKFTHSCICALIVGVLASFINRDFGLLLGMNYMLHIFLDSFTKIGVPMFYPCDNTYYGAKWITTGKSEEMFLFLMILYVFSEFLIKI